MKTVSLINGPNLNLLGQRQPELYGSTTLRGLEMQFCEKAQQMGFHTLTFQSNAEGALVDYIQQTRNQAQAIVINPAAYTHTSIAILDALNMFDGLVVEVHVTNIYAREEFRHHSYVTHRADHTIVGKGIDGYFMALDYIRASSSEA